MVSVVVRERENTIPTARVRRYRDCSNVVTAMRVAYHATNGAYAYPEAIAYENGRELFRITRTFNVRWLLAIGYGFTRGKG